MAFRPGRAVEKALIPRTLFGRALLAALGPLVVLQIVVTLVFYDRHWETVTRWLGNGFSGEVSMLAELVERAPDFATRAALIDVARRRTGAAISFEPGADLEGALARLPDFATNLDPVLAESFAGKLSWPFAVDTRSEAPRRFVVYVELSGGLLRVMAEKKRITSQTTQSFVIWTFSASVLLFLLAMYFLGRMIRPIRRLARAMESFGKGWDIGDFHLEGALEIRRAGHAFNVMRRRLLRFLQSRTEMLAAVSHDLRTPLTRMRLELEMAGGDPETVRGLRADVEEMGHLIDAYLDFARGEGEEAVSAEPLAPILEEMGERAARAGLEAVVEVEPGLEARLRVSAIRRCLGNLVDNASRFARELRISARADGQWLEIVVEDDGPGIPPAEREEALRPFVRLSDAGEGGGVGLGLAIALDVALAHGGALRLGDSPMGGLEAVLRLPR